MRIWVITLALMSVPLTLTAQSAATITTNAAIYATSAPAPNVSPMRVAAMGTVLVVVAEQGDWLQIEFADPQRGRRTGWIKREYARVSNPDLVPMDLSIRATPAITPAVPREDVDAARRRDALQQSANVASQQQGSIPADPLQTLAQRRQGFWFNAGLGIGSYGCEDCAGFRANGLSGGISLGGRLSDKLLLGGGSTGWTRESGGLRISVSTLDARLRFYPMRTSGFFITGGAGVGSHTISVGSESFSDFGLGVIVGVGWDIRVGNNVSLTPFCNGFAMDSSLVNANVGQLGLGVTIH
jgi:hypothetical protein